MQGQRFIVKYIMANNCFVHLSATWLNRTETEQTAIEVSHNGKTYYFSCVSRIDNDEILFIGATFARSLNIQEGDEVFVSSVKNLLSLSSVKISPRTMNDREILELQIERVQSNLLSQVRIVAKGQPIVAWISKFSSVTFIVEELEPEYAYGLLEQFTEMHVLDAIAKTVTQDVQTNDLVDKMYDTLAKVFPYFSKRKDHLQSKDNTTNYALLQSYRKRKTPHVFRVHPLPDFQSFDRSNIYDIIMRCPYHILILRNHLPKGMESTRENAMCKIRKVPKDRHAQTTNMHIRSDDGSSFPNFSQEVIVRIYVLEDILEKCSVSLNKAYFDLNSIHPYAYMSESLRITLETKIGSRVILEMIEETEQSQLTSIEIFPSDQSVTVEDFVNYVRFYSKHKPILLNSCSMISFDDDRRCMVHLSPADCNYATVDEKIVKNLVVHVRSELNLNDVDFSSNDFKRDLKMEKISTRCIKNLIEDCEIALDLSLGLRRLVSFQYDRENILICGGLGSGKTTICKMLIEHYREAPCFVYTRMIDCRSLKGKKVEPLQKIITTALSECVYYQPSILFLDDLESITSASLNDEDTTIDATNAARITDMLINIITQYQESHYISMVATCNDMSKIGLKLRPARGAQFFRTVLSIANLEKVDRIDILRLALGDKLCVLDDMNWNYYGNKTEGWMPQDLVDLAEKARFAAWKHHAMENSKASIVVKEEHINIALENCTPMSLQGVQLYKSSGHSWSEIGGLEDTKNSLTEILQWPLKYPEIFKNAPIKLQSGVLLYGMPGTGKTMLAKAIAGECGVNLISIKGPELLSKYIGVSEQSVRDVFERARRAKPCVLFFDEFDSLAPRRGHDSTGVTDRVVNQLLTQLDGVEDREGVAIVAASSRPDLLDPALLRPGRIDKCLHCPLPNEIERETIFAVLCDSQKTDKTQLNLKELAEISVGFTGADINAAITQARLSAFEDALPIAIDGKVDAANMKVTQKHLVESIKSTRPSLSLAEKSKYARIYARFLNGDNNFPKDLLKNQKATLA